MKKYYVIKEYDSLVRGKIDVPLTNRYVSIPAKTFDDLENFIISNKNEVGSDAIELMSISSKKGIGKVISVKNYVGLIQMKDGTKIEILPKIYIKDNQQSEMITRNIFLNMLKSLKAFPFKTFNYSSLGVMKNNIYEIFIQMFIQEVRELTKKGLKSSYIRHEDNERFYKGKMIFLKHIKKNIVHKERFYIEYDVFSINRAENKLIKSTLKKLLKISGNSKNIKDIEQLLVAFEMVEDSLNYQKDFMAIKSDRSMNGYKVILKWCKLFLLNKSFTTFAGSEVAYALLFPMEKVFEAYVASMFKKQLGDSYEIKLQDKSYHLFNTPKKFGLQPDIVVKKEDLQIVMDTKWKLLCSESHNYGISQGDMYQMYAYSKKYNANKVFVIYPYNEWLNKEDAQGLSYLSDDKVNVEILFVDLENIHQSIQKIIDKLEKLEI